MAVAPLHNWLRDYLLSGLVWVAGVAIAIWADVGEWVNMALQVINDTAFEPILTELSNEWHNISSTSGLVTAWTTSLDYIEYIDYFVPLHETVALYAAWFGLALGCWVLKLVWKAVPTTG